MDRETAIDREKNDPLAIRFNSGYLIICPKILLQEKTAL